MLLVASKFNLITKGTWDPSGGDQKYSYPIPYWLTAPSKYNFHALNSISKISSSGKSSFPSSHTMGFLAQKFDTTLLLIIFLATYFKSNSANNIDHLNNLSLKAGFSKRYFNGSILATTQIWNGRMMCLNFYMAHMSAKHDFFIGVYLVS